MFKRLDRVTPNAITTMNSFEQPPHTKTFPHVLSRSLKLLSAIQTVDADSPAAAARIVGDRQARRAMFVEFLARSFNWLICMTTRRHGTHDLFHANFGSATVFSRYAATYVALGNDADQFEVLCILDHRRATAA